MRRANRSHNPRPSRLPKGEEPPGRPRLQSTGEGPAVTRAVEAPEEGRAVVTAFTWTQFALCRDGYLSPQDADYLIDYFFRYMHPMYPLVDHKYCNIANRAQFATEEAFLCTTVLAITSRYAWHQASAFSARATEVHGALYRHVQSELQRCLWGSGPERYSEARTLSIIESIMLIVEWRPRSMDMITPPKDIVGDYALEQYGYAAAPTTADVSLESHVRTAWDAFKAVNITSWRLLCTAVNLADEIGLHSAITKLQHTPSQARHARVQEFLVSLVWERSFRLGRRCQLSHPADGSKAIANAPDGQFLNNILESRMELYRLTRLIENTLYPSARQTADLIARGNYQTAVDDFSGLLAAWKTRFDRVKASSPPLAKHLEIMWQGTRAFLYSISLRALLRERSLPPSRLESGNNGNGQGARPPPRMLQMDQSSRQDHHMAEEWLQASESAIGVALELHREGLLRLAPLNVLYHVIAASLAVLKAERLPLRTTTADPRHLLTQLVRALEDSSVDDAHFSARYAACLESMMGCLEEDRRRCVARAHGGPADDAAATNSSSLDGGGGDPTGIAIPGFETPFGVFEGASHDHPSFLDCNNEDWSRWLSF
ncbi:Fungal Zn binuclear cluster domain containing protein [Lasiodiplodia theobromae]|uniref:Fungal Zn binuclear cluster domain containing protein n=1 Tax=Lasiodiplodia theobromae TaxID=45133 RepID=UPI0015C2E532|nr:Fungal Zn binuclear cluster domain containing protein [Lasiodiplodia theobromae]KAF4540585.1 Fungal Zn binuclear cluster domain containing protein [Lasiodiplodia theobromae]